MYQLLLLLASVLTALIGGVTAEPAIVLNDADFDAVTQIHPDKDRMTAGPWFIMFYANWCPHCQRLYPVWDELANEMAGEVSVGKIDVATNRKTQKRFDVGSFPTLTYFQNGMMYQYEGNRNVGDMKAFLLNETKEDAEPIPMPMTQIKFIQKLLIKLMQDVQEIATQLPSATVTVLIGGLVIGITLGLPIGAMLFSSSISKQLPREAAKGKRQKGAKEF